MSKELRSKSPGDLAGKWVTLEILFGGKEMKDKRFVFKFPLNLLFSNFNMPLIRENNTEDRTLLIDGITECKFIFLPETTTKDKPMTGFQTLNNR